MAFCGDSQCDRPRRKIATQTRCGIGEWAEAMKGAGVLLSNRLKRQITAGLPVLSEWPRDGCRQGMSVTDGIRELRRSGCKEMSPKPSLPLRAFFSKCRQWWSGLLVS
jgi:hypothetical protein